MEGRMEGRMEERRAVLRRLIEVRFGKVMREHDARLAAASPEALDRYLERVVSAASIDDMFAD